MKIAKFIILAVLAAFPARAATAYYQPVASAAAMVALGTASPLTAHVAVTAYYASGRSGGGNFDWVAGSCAPDNGIFFAATGVSSSTGCWRRSLANPASISLSFFGAKQDGSTSDCAAVAAAYAALPAGGVLSVGAGPVTFPSASCSAIAVVPNTTTQCDPGGGTAFTMTGSSVLDNWFTATRPSGVYFFDCRWHGNSTASSNSTGGAILFYMDSGAPTALSNYGCIRCTFENFAQGYWVNVRNDSSHPLYNGTFSHDVCTSLSGNDTGPSNLSISADCIAFRGQVANLGGTVVNNYVDHLNCDATWIKRCVDFWSGTQNSHLTNNLIANAGAHTDPDKGGYGAMAYHDDPGSIGAAIPQDVWVQNNRFLSPFSAGFYSAENVRLHVTNNTCYGQTDTNVTDLPRGCFSGLELNDAWYSNNECDASFTCINVAPSAGGTVHVYDNTATGAFNTAVGIRIYASQTTNATSHVIAHHNAIKLTGTDTYGIQFLTASPTLVLGDVEIDGGRIHATNADIVGGDPTPGSSFPSMTRLRIGGGIYLGGTPSQAGILLPGAQTSPMTFDGIDFDMANYGSAARGLNVNGALDIYLNDLTCRNKTTGTGKCWYVDGAHGRTGTNAFGYDNVSPSLAYISSDFGITAPTFVGGQGDFVQNLNPTELGSASSKYIINGWRNVDGNTTWLQQRTLTGN